jgi:hypothetical protein
MTDKQQQEASKIVAQPNVQMMTQEDVQRRLDDLLSGRVKPPTPMHEYVVQQLAQTVQEIEQTVKVMQQAESAAANARVRVHELRGVKNKYIQDIRVWDAKHAAAEADKAEQAEAEVKSA